METTRSERSQGAMRTLGGGNVKQRPNVKRLSRKEFLQVVGGGAAGSMVLLTGCNTGPAEVVGSAQSASPAPPARSKKQTGADLQGSTDALVTFITTSSLRSMPDEAVALGKRCLIDGLGVMLAGSTTEGSGIVRQYVKAIREKKEASILGAESFMVPAAQAALANGAA